MVRKNLKLRVDDDGRLEIVDPGFDTLELIHSIDPSFEVKTSPLPLFSSPRFQHVRETGCGLSLNNLENSEEGTLWALHNQLLESWAGKGHARQNNEASFLDLKIELAYRVLKSCRLCARRCNVDRSAGEKGVCGLGVDAIVSEHYIHIAEEPPVNPSLNIVLGGCGLQCRFCQQNHLLDPSLVTGNALKKPLWKRLNKKGARTLSFIGGNPDESLYAILKFLSDAPARWKLPIIWNCHGYATEEMLRLLAGLVDGYVTDYKFGNRRCGDDLADAPEYSDTAFAAVRAMLSQDVPVIVRNLVLPGHVNCCSIPILERLKTIDQKGYLIISVRDQYCPEGLIKEMKNPPMNKRVTKNEVNRVIEYAQNQHFNIIS